MWHWWHLSAKESGLQCVCVNSDFTVLVSRGGRWHWVSMWPVWPSHSKWLSEQSHESASDFVLSLNIPPQKLFDESEGCSYGQLVTMGSFITTMYPLMHYISCKVFWQNLKSPRWLSPLTGQIWRLATSGFFQNSPWKGERFQTIDGVQENTTGQLLAIGRTVWGPKVLLWRRQRHHCPMYNVSCILYLL